MNIEDDGPIAMVDDNPGDVVLARECYSLSSLTNPWISFSHGEALLEHLERVARGDEPMPALVLLDINMPRLSGHEVLRRVRARPEFRELPIFCMLTSSSDPRDKQRGLELGASGFVVKPHDPTEYIAFFDSLAA